MISQSLLNESNRLNKAVTKYMTRYAQEDILALLEIEDLFYQLTALKKDTKDFSHHEICKECRKHNSINKLYYFSKRILPKLGISQQNILYYASLAEYKTIYTLRELNPATMQLYLLCYVFHRFQRITDNLVSSFGYYVHKFSDGADQYKKDKVREAKISIDEDNQKAGCILLFFIDKKIDDRSLFANVREKAFQIVSKNKFKKLIKNVVKPKIDEKKFEWDFSVQSAQKIKTNLRPLFKQLDFPISHTSQPLSDAITFLKKAFSKNKVLSQLPAHQFPLTIIPKSLRRYFFEKKILNGRKVVSINADKYEFLVYTQIANAIDSGTISFPDSTSYRSLRDELINDKRWENKEALLKQLDIPKLNQPFKHLLNEAEKLLHETIVNTNSNLRNGSNKHIKFNDKKDCHKWRLPYKKLDDKVNNPFYEQLPIRSICDILHFVNEQCNFLSAFKHIQPRYAKNQPDKDSLLAYLLAEATNHGITKMASISDLYYNTLLSTKKSYFRLQTLRDANDILSNAIADLPIFKHYNISERDLFGGVDGQKYISQSHTLKSRYSKKYFHLGKGIVAYSLVVNHVPTNCKVIGANEHESHYVFDIVYNNTSEISPTAIAGDMHSINRANFAILDLFDLQFTPRFTKINEKSKMIYSFKPLSEYKDCLIQPLDCINKQLILDEEDNIKRIIASLALKETTQHNIIRKICSYARHNKTQKALFEYDKIIRSLYIMRYIDDINLRRHVQRAINRTEAYHQLRAAISKVNGKKLIGRTDLDIEICNECGRLVANCIIYYNALMLSLLLEKQIALNNKKAVEFIKRLSPVAFQHINLFGRYEFKTHIQPINLDAMLNDIIVDSMFNFTPNT